MHAGEWRTSGVWRPAATLEADMADDAVLRCPGLTDGLDDGLTTVQRWRVGSRQNERDETSRVAREVSVRNMSARSSLMACSSRQMG